MDRIASLKAWAGSLGGINFPLLSDFWPHGAISQAYGIFNEESGAARRSIFVIDKEGVVRHKEIHQGTLPDPIKILEVLDKLKS